MEGRCSFSHLFPIHAIAMRRISTFLWSWALLAAVGAAGDPLPQLEVTPINTAEVRVSWPAPAGDFVLEETGHLAPLSPWQLVQLSVEQAQQRYTVTLPVGEHRRFFRLRYEPAALRTATPAIVLSLVGPDLTNVVAGKPFNVEVRASFNALLAGVAYRVSAAGDTGAVLIERNVRPTGCEGLLFLPATEQEPSESSLPVHLGGEGAVEVLLGVGTWPFDGLQAGRDVWLERLEIVPSGVGEFTLTLSDLQAVTTRWAPDGALFTEVILNPWHGAVTVQVQPGQAEGQLAAPEAPVGRRPGDRVPKVGLAGPPPAIDPNADGQGGVDGRDLVFVRARLDLDPAQSDNTRADVNRDQRIDLLDLVTVRNRLSPPAGSTDLPAPRLNEVAPTPSPNEAPWVEISYPSWIEPYFYLLELRNGADEALLNGWPEPILGWPAFLVVVFDGEKPMEYVGDPQAPTAVRVHVAPPANVFNPTNDQCRLYLAGQLVDAVSWGQQPERNAALNLDLFPIPPGGSIGRDGLEAERWVRFAQPTPGADDGLPTPLAMVPSPGTSLLLDQTTVFAWLDPRHSPMAYDLEVCHTNDLQQPVISATCYEPGYMASPGLVAGGYAWRIRPVAGTLKGPWTAWQEFAVLDISLAQRAPGAAARRVGLQGGIPLQMATIPYFTSWATSHGIPSKDTTMVCLECLQDQGPHAWDVPHGTFQPGSHSYRGGITFLCPHELGHAATAVAQWLNHYYGEEMTQDEINLGLFHVPNRSPEGDLGHGQLVDLQEAMRLALGDVGRSIRPLDLNDDTHWNLFRRNIEQGKPVAAQLLLKTGGGTGPVLLVGYMESDTYGTPVRHVFFLSPLLPKAPQVVSVQNLPSGGFLSITPMDPPGQFRPQATDPLLVRDSDGDGLNDLDETDRFPTDEQSADTDGDGIQDKTEVWSYKFGQGWVPRTADPDGDRQRAEEDEDSDGDGCPDGEEDRNHDGQLFAKGWLGLGQLLRVPADKETDPFWVDEFKVTLTSQSATIYMKECTRLTATVLNKGGLPVDEATVEFQMQPQIASFATGGGPPVTTVMVLTDKDGKATTDFCALETEGTVTITALYKPCPEGAENKAELQIQIRPYDWVFAVQEKAVLTEPELLNDWGLTLRDGAKEGVWEIYRFKNVGFQKVSGYFEHPLTAKPGAYIESIGVGLSYSGMAVLRVDGTNVNNLTWKRTSTNDLPTRWEIEIASPIWSDEEYKKKLPRYLFVTTRNGPERRTPLLWWKSCGTGAQNRRVKQLFWYPTYPYENYGRLLAIDWTRHSYEFFFGDGSVDDPGADPVCWDTPHPDPNGHTAVSFIPVKGIPGRAIGEWKYSGWPFDWGFNPWDKQGGTYSEVFNAYCKDTMLWVPDAPWTVTHLGDGADFNRYDIEEEMLGAGPPEPPAFLEDIRFKRDYIKSELQELEQRKLAAPQYQIRMLIKDN